MARAHTRPTRRLPILVALAVAILFLLWGQARRQQASRLGDRKWSLWNAETRLRGANVYQRRMYPGLGDNATMGEAPFGPRYEGADFERLAAAGANYVCLSHPGVFTEARPYELDPPALANLDRLVTLAADHDLWVSISFRTGPGRSEFSILRTSGEDAWFPPGLINDAVWHSPDAQAAWENMWAFTARHYAGHPNIAAYQLMVEPNANVLVRGGPYWNSDEFFGEWGGRIADWNRFYPALVTAVRKADPHTPIIVAGENHASPYWIERLIPTADPRSVYAVSLYEPFHYTHQPVATNGTTCRYPGWVRGPAETNWVDAAWLDCMLDRLDGFSQWHGAPVTVGEIGVQRWQPGAGRYMHDYLAGLEKRGINYALWLWECRDRRYSDTVTGFNFRLGPDPGNVSIEQTNALQNVIHSFWGKNSVRPQP